MTPKRKRVRELKFINSDARPKAVALEVTTVEDAATIMAWYGAFHAGDRYRVELDGQKIDKDQNGEMVPALEG